jgi:hypothetical protein
LHARAVRVLPAHEAPLLALATNGHPKDVTPQCPYLNAQEAADYLRIKRSRLNALRREGRVLPPSSVRLSAIGQPTSNHFARASDDSPCRATFIRAIRAV